MGFSRGMSGSRPWMITGMVAVGVRALRRIANPAPKTLFSTRLQPGDTFQISSQPMARKSKRRRGGQ
jgi:hypothetical protein